MEYRLHGLISELATVIARFKTQNFTDKEHMNDVLSALVGLCGQTIGSVSCKCTVDLLYTQFIQGLSTATNNHIKRFPMKCQHED